MQTIEEPLKQSAFSDGYDPAFLRQRRRDKRLMERTLWMIVGAMLTIMAIMAVLGPGTAPADAAATKPPQRITALERHLRAVCPSQPRSMTRARCVQWLQVAQCETGHQQYRVTLRSVRAIRWRYNGSSGYDGALQFKPSTWTSNVGRIPSRQLTRFQRKQRAAGRYHHAWSAPPAVQTLAAEVLRKRPDSSGLGNWPHCGAWFW